MPTKKQATKKPIEPPKEQPKESGWLREPINAFGTQAPALMFMGIIIGIILSFIFMISKPELFIQPAISYAVRETVAAQSVSTLQSKTQTPVVTPSLRKSILFHGEQLIYDDFSSKIFTWSEGSIGKDSVGYENGVYYLDLNDPAVYFTAFLWSLNNEIVELENFAIQVDVLGPLYTDWEQKQGILFGYQVDKTGNSYAFDISYDGTCRLIERINDEDWEVINTSNIPGFDINSPHTLTVTMIGSEGFGGFVDEEPCLGQIIDYTPGVFGVTGKISKNSGKLSFDNFYIFKIPKFIGE